VNAHLSLSFARVHLTTMAEFTSPVDSSYILMGTDQVQVLPLSRPPTVTSDTRFFSFRLTIHYDLHHPSVEPSVCVVEPVPTYTRDGPETYNAEVLRHLFDA